MMRKEELILLEEIALCYKPFLEPEEMCIYCGPGRTQVTKSENNSGSLKWIVVLIKEKSSTG